MRYYSDITSKLYNAEAELLEAEAIAAEKQKEKEEKTKQKKARAEEVEKAFHSIRDAEKIYYDLRNKFIEDYGSWSLTHKNSKEVPLVDVRDLFKLFNF